MPLLAGSRLAECTDDPAQPRGALLGAKIGPVVPGLHHRIDWARLDDNGAHHRRQHLRHQRRAAPGQVENESGWRQAWMLSMPIGHRIDRRRIAKQPIEWFGKAAQHRVFEKRIEQPPRSTPVPQMSTRMPILTDCPRPQPIFFPMRSSSPQPGEKCAAPWRTMETIPGSACKITVRAFPTVSNHISSRSSRKPTQPIRGRRAVPRLASASSKLDADRAPANVIVITASKNAHTLQSCERVAAHQGPKFWTDPESALMRIDPAIAVEIASGEPGRAACRFGCRSVAGSPECLGTGSDAMAGRSAASGRSQ
jgi:hypothetical protein